MTLSAKDFQALRPYIAAALVMIVAGASLTLLASRAIARASHEENEARAARHAAYARLQRLDSAESRIREDASMFATLSARGIIGEEKRPEWIELLKALRDRHHLPGLHYELGPQRQLNAGATGTSFLVASAMTLQIDLLHEEDLTRFFTDLRQQASAVPHIQNCRLSRLPRGDGELSSQPTAGRRANLQATCRVDWITVDIASADKEEAR
ncbi:hypothetical protein [Propionivibrio limicola]|uniref:hypothetical protein n=1 Tax=Propionivibrio limicola TaxID=167645 RepID=UPI0012909E71|nr:hypothetical protein [Propionivibrio limicola]